MAFLSLYKHEYEQLREGSEGYLSNIRHYRSKTQEWKNDIQSFKQWVAETKETPVALAIPANNGKVSFIYCTMMDDEGSQLLGIRGFSLYSRCSIQPTALTKTLVLDSVAKKVKNLLIVVRDEVGSGTRQCSWRRGFDHW